MELTPALLLCALVAASVLGMLPPIARRWSESGLHLLVAVSAGIFLGTVFLHLLPELAGGATGHDHGHAHGGGESGSGPWLAALGGFLGLFLLEKVWLRGSGGHGHEHHGPDSHTVVWVATYVGLSVHAFAAGLGLSALLEHPEVSTAIVAILWHKFTECFSLSSVIRLAGVRPARALPLLALFTCATPLGLLLGQELKSFGEDSGALLTGLAAGTFLYVAVCDLLPEVFHRIERRTPRVVALLVGVAAAAVATVNLDEHSALAEALPWVGAAFGGLLVVFLVWRLLRRA